MNQSKCDQLKRDKINDNTEKIEKKDAFFHCYFWGSIMVIPIL